MSKQRFIRGATILLILTFVARILGMLFKIPFDYIVGIEGLGIYDIAYPFYTSLVAISTVGLTGALSKILAEVDGDSLVKHAEHSDGQNQHSKGCQNNNDTYVAFKVAFKIFLIFGAVSSAIMFFFAQPIVDLFNWPSEVYYSLIGLSLAPLLVGIMSAFRGLFQGLRVMTPTGVSMIIEQIGRVVIGIGLAYIFVKNGMGIGIIVGGASFGATMGALVGALYLFGCYVRDRKKLWGDGYNTIESSIKFKDNMPLVKRIIVAAIPFTVMSLIGSLMALVDSIMLPNALMNLHHSSDIVFQLMGSKSRASTIVNIPLLISFSICVTIIPYIASNYRKNNKVTLNVIKQGLKMGIYLSVPAAVGLSVLSYQMIDMFFVDATGGDLLRIMAFNVAIIVLAQILGNILNAMGQYRAVVKIMTIAGLTKIIANILFVSIFKWGIQGAVYATILSYSVIVMMSYVAIRMASGYRIEVMELVVKPIFGALLMGLALTPIYNALESQLHSFRLSTLMTIALGVLIYAVAVVVTKGISKEEILKYYRGLTQK